MTMDYRGQWTGSNNFDSFAIININDVGTEITGRVSVLESSKRNQTEYSLWLWSTFKAEIQEDNSIQGQVFLNSIYDFKGNKLTDNEVKKYLNDNSVEYPEKILIDGKIENTHKLIINSHYFYPSIENKTEQFILSKASRSTSNAPSQHFTWEQFKKFTLEQNKNVIYRGQSRSWPLQTSYHRTGSADLVSYIKNEVVELERYINAVSTEIYNTLDNKSLGGLLNLAQHHGYPTPLLDWSKSPYVAAFFAFENKNELKDGGKISIFIFDEKKWSEKMGKQAIFDAPNIMICTLELPIINNPRALPQQALTMFSNMNDIESIIQNYENEKGDYLRRITIDASEADKVMKDLQLMGITWGALFPGLDGICKQLKNSHFT